ncbi:MAG TPA: hypothetical protein VIY51_09390, partial [Xanthobacteraceae bacterium]
MNVGVALNPVTSVVDYRGQAPVVAAAPAVPTELPTSQAINAAANIPAVRNDSRRSDRATASTARVIIDPQTSAIVFQSLDAHTGGVIKQVPTQALLRRRAYEEAQTVQALV